MTFLQNAYQEPVYKFKGTVDPPKNKFILRTAILLPESADLLMEQIKLHAQRNNLPIPDIEIIGIRLPDKRTPKIVEYGRDNGDGTYSVEFDRYPLTYQKPVKDQPIKYYYD